MKFDTHYEIRRETGLLDGKLTKQPVIEIHEGKASRSIEQQAALEFRSIVNEQKDKGYKTFQDLIPIEATAAVDIDPMDHTVINSYLPKGKTYANGQRKLMLAKDPKGVKKYFNTDLTANKIGWDKDWWVSKKLDGIRASVYYDGDKLVAMSRSGKDLSVAFTKIFQSKKWKTFFKKVGDNVMVDGELYKHGKTLQSLSGASQLKDYDSDRHDELEFWIFDVADEERTADERATLLNSLQGHFDASEDKIRINSQVKLMGYDTIKKIHDIFVTKGFEGAICRDASRLYGYGSRDDRMIKVKEFQEDEFEIVGMVDGLRPEDMVFTCITEDKVTFECKPVGPRELKFQYIRDMDNLIGKMLTVKYFNYTPDGKPFIPTGTAVRDYE